MPPKPSGPRVIPGATSTHPDPNAPYLGPALAALHPPLTKLETDRIGQYLKANAGYPPADIAAYEKDAATPDLGLLALYDLVIHGGIYNAHPKVVRTFDPSAIPGVGAAIAVGDFLALLTKPQTWLRVGEIVLGLLLLAIGAAHMSTAAGAALKAVPLAGKLIP